MVIEELINEVMDRVVKEHPELITESINEEYGNFPMPTQDEIHSGKMTPLYRVCFTSQLPNIYRYGYDREFTASEGGNAYGPGVYTTWDLKDSIFNLKTKHEYGDCIMKMYLIGGFDGFLIFDEEKAKQTYGRDWEIDKQLRRLFPADIAKRMYSTIMHTAQLNRCGTTTGRTAPCARQMYLTYYREYEKYGLRGVIYKGNRDGKVVVPYDFSSVIPYANSKDGRKWEVGFDDVTYKRMQTSIDSAFRYRPMGYKVLGKPIEGFQRIIDSKTGKYNIIAIDNDELVFSNGGVDAIAQINPETGIFDFTYNNKNYIGCLGNVDIDGMNGEPFYGILTKHFEPWMDFDFNDL